jgi:glutathione peroxidase
MTAVQNIEVKTITGEPSSLATFAGKVLLVVNVASKCGLTPQYEGLEAIYRGYREQGLVVLGFPANDFAGQEPGSDEEIQTFCETKFEVDFPLFSKIAVTGEGQHPLYRELTTAVPVARARPGDDMRAKLQGYGIQPNPPPSVLWNFEKFLVGRDGEVIDRFSPDVPPDDPLIVEAIEQALAKPG